MRPSLLTALLALGAYGHPKPKGCPPLNRGTFVINQYQLYPENADWDEDRCLVWFG